MKAISKGYPYITTKHGVVRPLSESEASTEQCAILIETVHEVAGFLGVRLKEYEDG